MLLTRYRMPWRSPDFLDGLRLRRAARGLTERPHDGASRQPDLEAVVPIAFGAAQHEVGGLRKCACVGALTAQSGFGCGNAPRLVRDAPEREARLPDRVAVKFECCRHRYQGERIG